jgi:tRNA wybutosine-synthesizing protein 2
VLKTSQLNKKRQWTGWADDVSQKIHELMCSTHPNTNWKIITSHIEHVKSYAPHVDHVVLDLECRPI